MKRHRFTRSNETLLDLVALAIATAGCTRFRMGAYTWQRFVNELIAAGDSRRWGYEALPSAHDRGSEQWAVCVILCGRTVTATVDPTLPLDVCEGESE